MYSRCSRYKKAAIVGRTAVYTHFAHRFHRRLVGYVVIFWSKARIGVIGSQACGCDRWRAAWESAVPNDLCAGFR